MGELVVVANRGPATFYEDAHGVVHTKHAAGGLAPSLSRALAGTGALWIAAAMNDVERRIAHDGAPESTEGAIDLHLVDLSPEIVASAYRAIANGVLWFLHHDLFDHSYRPVFNRQFHAAWEGYRAYNRAFADVIADHASRDATVMVHDYHLALVGTELAVRRPDLRTVHFSHTPFCTSEELRVLPEAIAHELMASMAAFGACGFHSITWAENFTDCAMHTLGYTPAAFVAPLGVDADQLRDVAATQGCLDEAHALAERIGDRKLIVRNDRIELSKNLLRGFLAFEELLDDHPQWREHVVFLARAYPSREDLPEYLAYRGTVEQAVARINARFATATYTPIEFVIEDNFEGSIAASSCYDVLLVNPIRDGMNLVAKEGPIVNTRNGVLALSSAAGAFEELGEVALRVDPFDISGTAAVLHKALVMSDDERATCAQRLVALASAHEPEVWFNDVARHAQRSTRPERAS